MRLRVLDRDGAVADQPYLPGLTSAGEAEPVARLPGVLREALR